METNGMFSGGSGLLGLEMSLNHHQQQPLPPQQNPNFLQRHQQPPFSPPVAGKQPYPFAPKPFSDEDEPHSNNINTTTGTEDSGGEGKMQKGSPWQRMKWTDNMVRLLIMVVFYVGDEVGSEPPASASDAAAAAKKKGGVGALQKKGKWKSVSRAMMERGFYVSPQQCEDKFNDLNKRYKRVNDILGKGTACKVVENQSLLETMDHLPAKTKEEVKKLLNSKHLFFIEMCAYHNSCGHSPPAPTDQHPCVIHSNEKTPPSYNEEGSSEEEEEEEEEDEGLSSRKRSKSANGYSDQLGVEVMNVMQDSRKSVLEKRQWVKGKMMKLEEAAVVYEGEAYELEKQRLKWVKFSCKKEREMAMEKLRNEKMKLENQRMLLLLRHKDLELLNPPLSQQQYSSTSNRTTHPSSTSFTHKRD